jgi:hypothetical protein
LRRNRPFAGAWLNGSDRTQGYVPPRAIDRDDADNNGFHAKQIVMDLDGSISTEVAIIHNETTTGTVVTPALRSAMTRSRCQAGHQPCAHTEDAKDCRYS